MTQLDTAAAAQATARALDANDARARAFLTDVADFVWAHPEVCFQERESSAYHADALRKAGFETMLGVGALDTAFVAEWTTPGAPADAPVIAFMPEYDALPTLANTTDLAPTPAHTNQPGHGCNHSLLGAACSTAAVLLREALTDGHPRAAPRRRDTGRGRRCGKGLPAARRRVRRRRRRDHLAPDDVHAPVVGGHARRPPP